jgi:hypothetical protein
VPFKIKELEMSADDISDIVHGQDLLHEVLGNRKQQELRDGDEVPFRIEDSFAILSHTMVELYARECGFDRDGLTDERYRECLDAVDEIYGTLTPTRELPPGFSPKIAS